MKNRRTILFTLITIAGMLLFTELVCAIVLETALPELSRMRKILKGDVPAGASFQRAIGQSYLNYVPSPGYTDEGGIQHNEQGYRGNPVTFQRIPGVKRILFLGGSTTYGWGIGRADQTYPAYLEHLINRALLPSGKKVEIINAGLPWGTTAEMLTHYHFKFHFYQPDLIIINPGGNDAESFDFAHYQPDYSHWRRPMTVPSVLPFYGRLVLTSRAVTLLLMPLLYGLHPGSQRFVSLDNLPPDVQWYPETPYPQYKHIPKEHRGFFHNLDTLLDEIQKDGSRVLLVPFRVAPHNEYSEVVLQATADEEEVLKDMARSRGLGFAPYPVEVTSPGNWIDGCHTNENGAFEKAEHILPYALKLLADSKNAGSRR
jgi:lysophospholipase L1-like esterase